MVPAFLMLQDPVGSIIVAYFPTRPFSSDVYSVGTGDRMGPTHLPANLPDHALTLSIITQKAILMLPRGVAMNTNSPTSLLGCFIIPIKHRLHIRGRAFLLQPRQGVSKRNKLLWVGPAFSIPSFFAPPLLVLTEARCISMGIHRTVFSLPGNE